MEGFSKKKRSRSSVLLRFGATLGGVALLLFLSIVIIRASWRMYERFAEASEQRHAAELQLGELQEKEQGIQAAVAVLSSERGVEEEIRSRFGVAKPGEGEIKIVRDKDAETLFPEAPESLWQRILGALSIW